jgi:hypothetical protein
MTNADPGDINSDAKLRVRVEQYRIQRALDDVEHDAWYMEEAAELKRLEENDGCIVKPTASGVRSSRRAPGESWLLWWLFDRTAVEATAGIRFGDVITASHHLAQSLTCRSSSYGSHGQHFSGDPYVSCVTKHRVLICQHVGLDI